MRQRPRAVPEQVRARLERLARAGTRTDPDFAELRALLDSVPAQQRSRPWRQASVLTNVYFRRRAWPTLRMIRRIRTTMTAQGRGQEFDVFAAEVETLLGEVTLSTHGYLQRLDGFDPDHVWAHVAELGARLDQLGLSWFVCSGTLLGLIRSGGLLPRDDDVDLCVLLHVDGTLPPEAAAEHAARAWQDLHAQLSDVITPRRAHRVAKVELPGLPTIDLFPAWITQGRLFAWPWSYGQVAASAVLPPGVRTLGGHRVCLPADPEAVLEVNFGAGWREPDPFFTFDWTGARARFANFPTAVDEAFASDAGPGNDPDE